MYIVGGKKLAEGTYDEMQKKFNLEIASHKASVELRELEGDEWRTIRKRMVQ